MNTWPKPILISATQPDYFRSVLLDNGDRYAVGYRRKDEKYYVEQDGLQFFPQYWYPLPSETA